MCISSVIWHWHIYMGGRREILRVISSVNLTDALYKLHLRIDNDKNEIKTSYQLALDYFCLRTTVVLSCFCCTHISSTRLYLRSYTMQSYTYRWFISFIFVYYGDNKVNYSHPHLKYGFVLYFTVSYNLLLCSELCVRELLLHYFQPRVRYIR